MSRLRWPDSTNSVSEKPGTIHEIENPGSSLYDIQVDVLRLFLTLHDNPDFVDHRQSRLREKTERYGKDFRKIIDDDLIGAFHRKLKGDLAKLKGPQILGRGRGLAIRIWNVRNIRRDFNSIRARIVRWTDAFESATGESREQSIVFYRERDGECALRAYHTRDLRLQQADAARG